MSRVVVKIGTSSLTDLDGVIDESVIAGVAAEVAALYREGHLVTIVTSGAIAAGLPVLGLGSAERPSDSVTLQALSSIGQPALLQTWSNAFAVHEIVIGQILLAPHNFGDRGQYLHARSTLSRMHELGVVPLINENDAVTDSEIRYGDNDRIAALVAHLLDAETLVLLTDTDGVLTADPRVDPSASLIDEIAESDLHLEATVGGAGSVRGSGGMASKLTAARIAAWSGVRTVIANANRPGVVLDAVNGVEGVGTTIIPRSSRLSARKLWIGFAVHPVATVQIDSGARSALESRGVSLLAVGVEAVIGSFERGDAVEIVDESGEVVAKGLARMTSVELEERSAGNGRRLVVHADDLVLLS